MGRKNSVKSEKQVSEHVKYVGKIGGNPRILFLGNSITKQEPCEEIGWYGDWGMAASSKENDYAHRIMSDIESEYV